MDPVTILGAVGSVVGIAGFGLQLAQFLDQFVEGAISANQSLDGVRAGLHAVYGALEEVSHFLKKEKKYVSRGQKPQLFAQESFDKVQSIAKACLRIFCLIEATILNGKDDSRTIDRRLSDFHATISAKKEPLKLNLDSKKLNKRQAFLWSFRTRGKLEGFRVELHQLQTTLILIFQVITIRANLRKPNPKREEIEDSAEYIRYLAAQSNYQDMGPNVLPHYPPSYPPPYPPPPRVPWMDDYATPFGGRVDGMNERRRSIRHPQLPHTTRNTRRRRRSESEDKRRGRTRHRRSFNGGDPREERAYSSPVSNNTAGNSRARERRSLSADQAATTALDNKIEAAKQHIAKRKPKKAATKDAVKQDDFAPQSQGDEAILGISYSKPLNSDMEEETFSMIPQTGSPLETVISNGMPSPTPAKKASTYKSPFVTDQPSEMSSQETIKPVQNSKSQADETAVDLDPATEYTLPVPIFSTFTSSPVQLPIFGAEPVIHDLPLSKKTDKKKRIPDPMKSRNRRTLILVDSPAATQNSDEIVQPNMPIAEIATSESNGVSKSQNLEAEQSFRARNPACTSLHLGHSLDLQEETSNKVPLLSSIASADLSPISNHIHSVEHGEKNDKVSVTNLDAVADEAKFLLSPVSLKEKTHLSTPKAISIDTPADQNKASEALSEGNLGGLPPDLKGRFNISSSGRSFISDKGIPQMAIDSGKTIREPCLELRGSFSDPANVMSLHEQTVNRSAAPNTKHEPSFVELEVVKGPTSAITASSAETSPNQNARHLLGEFPDTTPSTERGSKRKQSIEGPISSPVQLPSSPASNNHVSTEMVLTTIATEVSKDEATNIAVNQEIASATQTSDEQSQALVIPSSPKSNVSSLAAVIPNVKQQIHITLSAQPAWERPLNFEISPWTDTVFAGPEEINSNGTSTFDEDRSTNGRLTTLENESNTSINSNSMRKRESVIESLKRMCRRDFVTEDDLETMFPGVGCFITAYTIKGASHHQIPYSGQFSLRKTHLYSSNSKWWKEFAFLSLEEISSLNQILTGGQGDHKKFLVLLKWLRKERLRFWSTKHRVLIAIVYNEPSQLTLDETEAYSYPSASESTVRSNSQPNQSQEASVPPETQLPPASTILEGAERSIGSQSEITEGATTGPIMLFAAYTIRVFDPHNIHGDSSSVQSTTIKESFSQSDIARRIWELNQESPKVIQKKMKLLDIQQEQIARLLNVLSTEEKFNGYSWSLMQLETIDGPSKGYLVVTVYLRNIALADPIEDFAKEQNKLVIENPALMESDVANITTEPDKLPADDLRDLKLPKQESAGASPEAEAVPLTSNNVTFKRVPGSQRQHSRRSLKYDRRRNYSSRGSSEENSYETDSSGVESSNRRRKGRRRPRKKSSRASTKDRDKSREKVAATQPRTSPPYPPYSGGQPTSPYGHPASNPAFPAMAPPYHTMGPSYPHAYPTPSPYPNLSPYPSSAPGYFNSGYSPVNGMMIPYGGYTTPYPPYYNPTYFTPTLGAGGVNTNPFNPFSPAPVPRPPSPPSPPIPSTSPWQGGPTPNPNPSKDSGPEIETRSERIRKASVRKATIRPPVPLRPRASVPTSPNLTPSYPAKYQLPPPSARRQSNYSGYPAPIPSYGAPTPSYGGPPSTYAPPPQQLLHYGARPPPSAYSMPPPPSSYADPFPPRRTQLPYPEYYDGRSYNPLAPLTEADNTNDIVNKLYLEWTPAGGELNEMQNMEKDMEEKEDSTESGEEIYDTYSEEDRSKDSSGEDEKGRGGKGKEKETVHNVMDESSDHRSEREKMYLKKQARTGEKSEEMRRHTWTEAKDIIASTTSRSKRDKDKETRASSEQRSGQGSRREKGGRKDEGISRIVSGFILLDKEKQRVKDESRFEAPPLVPAASPAVPAVEHPDADVNLGGWGTPTKKEKKGRKIDAEAVKVEVMVNDPSSSSASRPGILRQESPVIGE